VILRAVGLVPAAGHATRLGNLGGSKELLAVWRPPGHTEAVPVIRCLLASFASAGVPSAIIAVRAGKEDIRATLGPRSPEGLKLDYVDVGDTPSPSFTVSRALAGRPPQEVILGFPDIMFEPESAALDLLDALNSSAGTDVALGLFPHPRSLRADIVETDASGLVHEISPAGHCESADWTWGLAAWRPNFTAFLAELLDRTPDDHRMRSEMGLGAAIRQAIGAGFTVKGRLVSRKPFLDVGTRVGLEEARRRLAEPPN